MFGSRTYPGKVIGNSEGEGGGGGGGWEGAL